MLVQNVMQMTGGEKRDGGGGDVAKRLREIIQQGTLKNDECLQKKQHDKTLKNMVKVNNSVDKTNTESFLPSKEN